MRKRYVAEDSGGGLGLADLFMLAFGSILILMFLFMVNQGVKAQASKVDQTTLAELVESQQQALAEAAERAKVLAAQQKRQYERSADDKQAMLEAQAKAEANAATATAAAATAEQAAQASGEQVKTLRGENERLKDMVSKARAARSLRVDLLQDMTGSQSTVIESAKGTTRALTRTLPNVLMEVEMGCIGYRDMQLAEAAIKAVKRKDQDGGASIRRMNAAVEKWVADGGTANIESAIRKSMARMEAMPGSPRECLVVSGDVGLWEVSRDQVSAAEDRLLADVEAWCKHPGKNRRVLAIYTGSSGDDAEGFFQRLGSVNEASKFSQHHGEMFELVLSAAFDVQEIAP